MSDLSPPASAGSAASAQSNLALLALPAVRNLVLFNIFNAVSFNIVLGAPMILLARSWGASNLYIGSLSALLWLMMSTQLYMAPRVEYIGFRKLLLAGWTGRTVFLAIVALLPFASGWLTGRLPGRGHMILLVIVFVCMFAYNFLRGIATTSYMPWLRTLIDPEWRGRYFSLEHSVANISAAVTFLFCGWVLGGEPTDTEFGMIFIVSVLAAMVSIVFLARVDSPPPLTGRPQIEPLRIWVVRVWRVPVFRSIIRTSVVYYLSISAWMTFTVIFLRDQLGVSERTIMLMNGANMTGIVLSAWYWGMLADRFGSRPVMALATRLLLLMLFCWLLLTLGLLPVDPWLLTVCFCLYGVGYIGYHVSNLRLTLNQAPREFPVLALSLFMVCYSLSCAVAPVVWGFVLDWLHEFEWGLREGVHFDRFSLFYGGSLVLLLVTKRMVRQLPNERGTHAHMVLSHVFYDAPLRTASGIYELLRGQGGRLGDRPATIEAETIGADKGLDK